MIQLRPYQDKLKTDIYKAWKDGFRNVLAVMPTGGGKCLGVDTPVIMYDGTTKKVQDVKQGDMLMGPDSKPRCVLSTCHDISEMFEITPVKGDSWVCNDVHMLSLRLTGTDDTIDIPLDEYLQKSSNFKHLHKQFRTGVDFPSKDVSFDPYLLGVLLAEGTNRTAHLTISDLDILVYIKKWCHNNLMKTSIVKHDKHWSIGISDIKQGWNKNIVRKMSKQCTSKNDRHVPKEFLLNDRETRLQVLAGLLDGDGHLQHNSFQIITKYDSLNRDILFLARSLGLAAYSSKVTKRIKSSGFEGVYNSITISGDTDMIPNIVYNKKAEPRRQKKNVLNTGFKVESIGQGEYYGFELDCDGRFLLGDFTVTHNTKTFVLLAKEMAIDPVQGSLPTAIMVHRKELVSQISMTLAEEGIFHNIIAPLNVIKGIQAEHRRELGNQFYQYKAEISVISVDTLNSRIRHHIEWAKSIKLWITDEAAHVTKDNKWGKALKYFPNALGLGVTATPQRLDKKGLGTHADGVFDTMVIGPPTKWLIDNKFLCRYKIALPKSDFQQYLGKASNGSDFSKKAMIAASSKSRIVGDVVENYKKHANGKQAIVFASDINTARKMEEKFIKAGVTAKLLTGETPSNERLEGLRKFREKKTQVLINVDLFDEGLDVPGIECVIMARPTMSLAKFLQMVGRGLRPDGDKILILIDHVGNIKEHMLPDTFRKWTLDRIIKRKDKVNLLRFCNNIDCNQPYDRTLTECPWCGTAAILNGGGGGGGKVPPEQVDGDLELIDPETIRAMEAAAQLEHPAHLADRVGSAHGSAAGIRAMQYQQERIQTQKDLSDAIAEWAGRQRFRGFKDRRIHKSFYVEHGMTITMALSEKRAEMLKTIENVKFADDIW